MFVTSPGLDSRSILEFVVQEDIVVIPGAVTPTELSTAWQAGADFVKVFPCHSMGGPHYIRSLRGPFPDIPMVASGGVNQVNAEDFISGGAAALGIGTELIPREAVESRNSGLDCGTGPPVPQDREGDPRVAREAVESGIP